MRKKTNNTTNNAPLDAEVITFNPMLSCECGYTDAELVAEIKDATMRKAVMDFAKAQERGTKAQWDVAKACHSMSIDHRQEFESDTELAHFLGLPNRMAFSRLHRAGEYYKKALELGLGTSQVFELLPLASDKYGNLDVADHLDKIAGMTRDEVREYIKQFKVAIEDKAEAVEKETAEEEEAAEECNAGDTSDYGVDVWLEAIKIEECSVSEMDNDTYHRMLLAMRDVAISFGLSEDNVWCLFDR